MTEKFILGTAQIGLNYGINNQTGQPTKDESFSILNTAFQRGIRHLDTASAYGNAYEIIGDFHKTYSDKKFNIITKFIFQPQKEFSVNQFVTETCEKLRIQFIDTCMFHDPSDFKNHPQLLNSLIKVREQGSIKNIGISIYTNEEFEMAIESPAINIIQIPFNLLDNKKKRGALIIKAKKKQKLIHARSVFLQGLLLKEHQSFPDKLTPLLPYINLLNNLASTYNLNLQEMAFNYTYNNSLIDMTLCGVESAEQLNQNFNLLGKNLPESLMQQIDKIDVKESFLLNPSNWPE